MVSGWCYGPAEAGHYDGASGSGLQIELRGNPAAILTMATRLRARESGGATAGFGPDFAGPQNATRSPETGDLELQITLVAGGGFEPPTFGL